MFLTGLEAKATSADCLKGVKSFGIVVEPPGPELAQKGYTESWLKQQLQIKLKEARLPVDISNRASWLYLNANAVQQANFALAYNIRLEFNDSVTIDRNGAKATASTWSTAIMGISRPDRLENLRRSLNAAIEQFISDFQQVNQPLFPSGR